jgi:hypothetical protein
MQAAEDPAYRQAGCNAQQEKATRAGLYFVNKKNHPEGWFVFVGYEAN